MRKITAVIPYTYGEEIIPPRCRKPRPVRRKAVARVAISVVDASEAPVAIVEINHRDTRTYRWFNKRLYALKQMRQRNGTPNDYEGQTLEQFEAAPVREHGAFWSDCKGARRSALEWARSILFVNNMRWELVGEPRYVVMTFGLGCNHGLGWGTCLCSDNSYNSNISRDRYFRADEFDLAVAFATATAKGRGDTKALPILKQKPTAFEVLIPEAIRLRPSKEHGKGDPFINRVEGIITAVKDPVLAGLAGTILAFQK